MLTQPRQESDVSIAILDAAERAFAEFGYRGASLRSIAREAGVNQAMVAYYFGSKEGLVHAVIRRRSSAINDERGRRLDALLARGRPTVPELLEAFLRPMIELGKDERRGGFAYVKLLATLIPSIDELSKRVISENFDAIARRFVDAFRLVAPGMGESDAVRAYLMSLGVGMATTGIDWRAERLMGGAYDGAGIEALIRSAVAFSSAGVAALMRETGSHDRT